MKCLVWNPQSLQNKILDFINLLDDNEVDFSFITEHWMNSLNNHTTALLRESGYNFYHYFRKNRKGGGVGIIAKNKFIPKNGKTINYQTFEIFMQSFKIPNSHPLTLVVIYRHGKENNTDFIREFYDLVEFLFTNTIYFLICGDFNIHINKPNDRLTIDFIDILDTFSLKQSVHEPTHILGNTLDLIIHDPTLLNISDVSIEKPDRSDHFLVFFQMSCNFDCSNKKQITFRNLKNVDFDAFKNEVENKVDNFLTNSNVHNFEETVLLFKNTFGEVVNEHAPIVTKTVQINNTPGWIDTEFKAARSERRRLYKTWKRTQTIASREAYETSRCEVNNMSIAKRKLYFSKCISESSSSQRDIFKICNSLLDVRKSTSLPDCENSALLANKFNQYFVQKITDIRNNMKTVDVNNVYINKESYGIGGAGCAQSTLSRFNPVSEEELKKIILSRKIKTCAQDTIPAELLKACLDQILPALTKLVNISLSTGSIQGLKEAVITPLLKKYDLDKETLSNYRPVHNILYLSKVIETVVSIQLTGQMDRNNLHIPYQSGYKPNHSCETLLLSLVDSVLKTMDDKKCTIYMLLDLSSAFDTVEHDRELSILYNEIGLRDVALEWFESYLLDRRQAVNIKGSISEFSNTSYGVPQGSVLGPILFNIYVRNFIQMLNEAGYSVHGYADDHQVGRIFSIEFQYSAIRCSIPHCLELIACWMKASFLKLNSSKTQVIIFAPKQLVGQLYIEEIKLRDGCRIPVTNLVTNLGVQFDSELTFAPQINAICSSSYKLLRNLASVRKFLSTDDLRTLVQSIIVSRIDNCNSLLYGVLVRNLNKLQKLQNACARMIYGKKRYEHVTPLLHELHWLPIRQRIVFKILLFVYKFFNNSVPTYIMVALQVSERGESLLKVPRTSTPYGDRAFSNCAPKLWNALPTHIRCSATIGYFRSQLKHHLFENFEIFLHRANIYSE